ncbi:MAG: methyltransferase domain-containing protein [Syntrophobacteraceae bacterium]|nr:methyltransferase domain-containing protein [Syntrophobacteraceae bacterium]
MKRQILKFLICPECLPEENCLHLEDSRCPGEEILDGRLECGGCGKTYPISEGIACLTICKSNEEKVKSGKVGDIPPATSAYETPEVLSAYLWSHYADLFGDPDATKAYSQWAEQIAPVSGAALDAGCATGRFCFEMSAKCDLVIGIDASRSFIATARRILRERNLAFPIKEEGLICSQKSFFLPPEWDSAKVEFIVADAQALPFRSGSFACVASLNVIDKTSGPFELIKEARRVARGTDAQLLLSDPFSWSENICDPKDWLGGTVEGRFAGAGIDNVARLVCAQDPDGGSAWTIGQRGSVWWKIRNHRNHFELIRSLFLKAQR